ncbi:DUF6801 domain-containing protein [Streptomyces sp. KLOTTS4A1]|uniref:DUF6801 domain-containing protein n=1 Tax=Streptomyces sp. KLOTTS4A1 TaxID=3390996 RepID=UPI0039F54EB5
MTTVVRRGPALRLAVVAAGALVAGFIPGANSAARDGVAHTVRAAYDCRLPSSQEGVGAEITVAAVFPGGGVVGEPIRPRKVSLVAALPPEQAARVSPEAVQAVGGTARLTTTVAQGPRTAEAEWAGLLASPVEPAADGGLEITFTGEVPDVTVGAEGAVTFTAGELTLDLSAMGADGASGTEAVPGTGEPPVVGSPAPKAAGDDTRLTCTPAPGADMLLAAVPVRAATEAPDNAPDGWSDPEAPAIQAGPRALGAPGDCPAEPPEGELAPKRLPTPPEGASVTEGEPTSACAVPVGFASMRKLNSSLIVNDPEAGRMGLMHLGMLMRQVQAPGYVEYDHLGIIRLPDAEGTFLAFGFQPTSAKVRFEAEPATIVNAQRGDGPMTTRASYRQHLRLHDVRINGVPLDVGPDCRTSRPVETVLSGTYPVSSGGLLQGELDIPPFSGCGTPAGENLDALFTGVISGPGNVLKIQQGSVCTGSACGKKIPPLPEL